MMEVGVKFASKAFSKNGAKQVQATASPVAASPSCQSLARSQTSAEHPKLRYPDRGPIRIIVNKLKNATFVPTSIYHPEPSTRH